MKKISVLVPCYNEEQVLPLFIEAITPLMEKYPDSFTVIKGFTGDVVFETKKERYYDEVLPITTITGIGTIRFQSGFTDDDGSIKFQLSQCNMD